MKAFSFLTILESLSKKLSILRTKMHSDNLRVDYESITSRLRVNYGLVGLFRTVLLLVPLSPSLAAPLSPSLAALLTSRLSSPYSSLSVLEMYGEQAEQ